MGFGGISGLGICSTYPDSITFGQALQCAFDPWTDTCKRLREQADLECAQYSGALPPPSLPPAPGVPPEAYSQTPSSSRDPQLITDQIIAEQNAAYQAQVKAFMEERAAAADAEAQANQRKCGMFTSWNDESAACLFNPVTPGFLVIAAIVMVALMAWKK